VSVDDWKLISDFQQGPPWPFAQLAYMSVSAHVANSRGSVNDVIY